MKAFVEEGATEGTKTRLQLLINFYSPSEFYIKICRKRCNLGNKTMLQHFSIFVGQESVQKCGANFLNPV